MKKMIFFLVFSCFFVSNLLALRASVTYSTFKGVENNFVEIHLHLVGSSVTFQPIDTVLSQAAVDVTLIFTKKDEKNGDKIVKFDRFRLNSPASKLSQDFIDLKRYELKNGSYNLEATFEDVNKPENTISYDADFKVYFSKERIQQSDLQLISTYRYAKNGEKNVFIKSGLYLENTPFNFYGRYAETLIFYNEIYNTEKKLGEDFMLSYIVEKLTGNDQKETVLIGHKRKQAAPVVVALQKIDIRELESGNYNLKVEIRDRNKALLSKKSVTFQRSNPNLNVERETIAEETDLAKEFVNELSDQELQYSLRAIAPLVSDYDGEFINTLIAEQRRESMQMYLYSYWALLNPNNPKSAYDEYMNVARAVDRTYASGFGYGFESDRGFAFMKYGKPSDVVRVEDEPSAPPYEIWTYYDFPKTRQSNVKFLFYNPSLATGQFILLHSTAYGEINNPQWERMLYLDSQNAYSDQDNIQGTGVRDGVGRQARRLFEDN